MQLWYDPKKIPADVCQALSVLSVEYLISAQATDGATGVEFCSCEEGGDLVVQVEGQAARIEYRTVAQACRGVGLLLALKAGESRVIREKPGFQTMGLMLDCSRNAVMTVEYVKKWLRRMALSGYNMVMLYTEDTYKLDGEPLFGYLRGSYTRDEIREIDDYAAGLGIELIPCIQTLGHLEQALKWRHAYTDVRDTASVLLVDEPATYALIEKMVSFWASVVRSRRIHVGMDETHDLGRGRYMDLFGYRRGFDIFNEHLKRVVGICQNQGLHSMIWSDMYFRMGSRTGGYYDTESQVPWDVAAAIPKEVELVYWDYYHTTEEFYREWIRRHREMGFEPIMGSGIWTWGRFVYSHPYTAQTMLPCVRACLQEGLQEIFFTMWKDDGASVDFGSASSGVLYAAEAAYNGGVVDDERWAARFQAVCKSDLEVNMTIAKMDPCTRYEDGEVNTRVLLWEEPLFSLYRRSLLARPDVRDFSPADYYGTLAEDLARQRVRQGEAGAAGAGDLDFAQCLAETLALKATFRDRLGQAYAAGDRRALQELADELVPRLIAMVRDLWQAHRRVWMAQNKVFGFEVICVRYGGLILRLEEIAMRLKEYLGNQIERIDELEEPFEPLAERLHSYRSVATPSSIL